MFTSLHCINKPISTEFPAVHGAKSRSVTSNFVTVSKQTKDSLSHQPPSSYQFSPLLGWASLPQGKDVSTNWDFPPDARSRLRHKLPRRVHHQHPVGGQAVHQAIWRPPFGGPLLRDPAAHRHQHTQADVKVRGIFGRHRGRIVEEDIRGGGLQKQLTLLFCAAIFSSVQNDYCTDWCTEIRPRLRMNPSLRERQKRCIMNTN